MECDIVVVLVFVIVECDIVVWVLVFVIVECDIVVWVCICYCEV